MVYTVTPTGTIVTAAAEFSPQTEQLDPLFAAPANPDEWVGRNLFNFIQGIEVSHVYRLLQERVLNTGVPVTFEYRCDSPAVRREMRMRISPDDSLIRYESVVLNETVRPIPVPTPSPKADVFIRICSKCQSYSLVSGSGGWKEIELILSEPELPEQFSFTHTFCEPCYEFFMDGLMAS